MKKTILLLLLFTSGLIVQAQMPRRLRRCGTSMIQERMANNTGTRAIDQDYEYVPHTGNITVPVILVNYQDTKFTVNDPQAEFEQYFNGSEQKNLGNGNDLNHGSIAQYFNDMSSGTFTVNFKVYKPITVSQKESYYGGNSASDNTDEKPQELVEEAVKSLIASGQISDADAQSFSSDGKTIDCVYIIYAGLGQNDGGSANAVWANTWNPYPSTAIDGKTIRWYTMSGELSPLSLDSIGKPQYDLKGTPVIAGIGVTCHEFSHALGLPDFYPTSSSAYLDNQEMEYWDLMDGGEYSGNGFCPTAYTAWEKNEMEWPVDIQELQDDISVSLTKSTEQGGTAYKITNPNNEHEYLMLEYFKSEGWNSGRNDSYDFSLGNGLLMYHVFEPNDYIKYGLNSATRFNNIPHFPGMAIVPADSICYSAYVHHGEANYNKVYLEQLRGDLFSYPSGIGTGAECIAELNDDNPVPNFCWYNKEGTEKLKTNKALKNIKYDTATGNLSFYYIKDVSTAIRNITIDKELNKRIYTIDGRFVGSDFNILPKGIYIINGRKIMK